MHDLRGLKLLCAAQDQVVVLAALEPAPKASDIAREIGPDGREVADIVLAAQQVGIPIRLEVRIESSPLRIDLRSEEHTSELQSLMRISYAVFCLKKKKKK